MSETALVHISRAKQALQKAKTIDEIKNVIETVERLRLYFRQQNESLEMQNDAAELGIYARHRAGEMLREGGEKGDRQMRGGDRKSNGHDVSLIQPPSLKEIGITEKQSSRWQSVAAIPIEQVQEIVQEYKEERKEISTAAILREVREIKRERAEERMEERREQAEQALQGTAALVSDRYRLWQGDALETALREIEPASVDAIITDPPYPAEFLQTFSDLSTLAAWVLKPGGHCLVMSGQSHLPEVLNRLKEHLRYQWTLGYFTPGDSVQVFGRRIKSNWKPIIWLVNGQCEWEHVRDTFVSDAKDKRFHEWGQPVDVMAEIIERFTVECQVVLDPFVGGGTTGEAALRLNRRFLGIDKEATHIATTAKRLEGLT